MVTRGLFEERLAVRMDLLHRYGRGWPHMLLGGGYAGKAERRQDVVVPAARKRVEVDYIWWLVGCGADGQKKVMEVCGWFRLQCSLIISEGHVV